MELGSAWERVRIRDLEGVREGERKDVWQGYSSVASTLSLAFS